MIRKIVAVWVSLAMFLSFVVIIDFVPDITPTVKATTQYVNETGIGGAYTSIQDAINDSDDGDTVFVYSGIYIEDVMINKTIILIGEDRNTTIIEPISGFYIENVDYTVISNFTIKNIMSIWNSSGNNIRNITFNMGSIYIDRSNWNNIMDNIITNHYNGIYISYSTGNYIKGNSILSVDYVGIDLNYNATNNIITENEIYNNADGINVYSDGNIILNNNVSNNEHGIIMIVCNDTIIENNSIFNNGEGINLVVSNGTNIANNNISFNNESGIRFQGSSDNIISDNNILNNENGISLDRSSRILIMKNNIIYNNYGIHLNGNANENNITDNIVTNNYWGIVLNFYSSYNAIEYNDVLYNEDGIHLEWASNNTVRFNNISHNNYGIFIDEWSLDNSLEPNIFIGNDYKMSNGEEENSDEGEDFNLSNINRDVLVLILIISAFIFLLIMIVFIRYRRKKEQYEPPQLPP